MKKISNVKLTYKALSVLLAFSFMATIIGFSVAYLENKNYTALTAKYDEAIEKISDLEISVSALMATEVQYTATDYNPYPAENHTQEITTTLAETEEDTAYTSENTTSHTEEKISEQHSEESATTKATSGTYYVTHSGKKYHVASCSYLSKSKIAITIDRIKAEGYSPCSRCIK